MGKVNTLAKQMNAATGPWVVPTPRGHEAELACLRKWAAGTKAFTENNADTAHGRAA